MATEINSVEQVRTILARELNGARKLAKLMCNGWDDYHLAQTYHALIRKVNAAVARAEAGETLKIRTYFA